MTYRDYLKTTLWGRTRRRKLKKSFKCQVCGSNDDILDVHHRYYEKQGEGILKKEKDMDLKVLCRSCHTLYHKYFGKRKMKLKYVDTIKNWIARGFEIEGAFKLVSKGKYRPEHLEA